MDDPLPLRDTPIGHIATSAPLATRVFARHGLDYCCGGGSSLASACAERGLDLEQVLAEIEAETSGAAPSEDDWSQAPLGALIEHILLRYHRPLDEELPRLEAMARKVYAVHGEKDPDRLARMVDVTVALRADLEPHMQKEEQILFPLIVQGGGATAGGPVAVMEEEHEAVGRMLRELRELTDDFTPPEGACNTWRALWHGLADLERSLHEHIHLENNVLFPRALGG